MFISVMVSFLSDGASISSCLFDLCMNDRDGCYSEICVSEDKSVILQ